MDKHLESNAHKSRTWQRHIDAWRRSGLSQRSYCESSGLALSTFQLWRRRLLAAGGRGSSAECIELVPVSRAPQSDDSRAGRRAAIVLCVREYRLELAEDVHTQALRRVLDALEAR